MTATLFLKKSINTIDLFVLAYELNNALQNSFIVNLYEITSTDEQVLLIKCRTQDGKKNFILDPRSRINITQFEYPTPESPSQFISSLRKYLKGRKIERIYQYNFDRILVIQIKEGEESWNLVIEFFSGGNFILVDHNGLIFMAQHYKKLKDRALLPKSQYIFPPTTFYNFLTLSEQEIFTHLLEIKGELVRIIARNFGVGGSLAEEICFRAGIEKNQQIAELNTAQKDVIFRIIHEIKTYFTDFRFSPELILDQNNNPIGFEPIHFESYHDLRFDRKSTMNEVIDEFFSKIDATLLSKQDNREIREKVSKHEKILQKQMEKIDESHKIREEALEQGHLLYQYLPEIQKLIDQIMQDIRSHKHSWGEIEQILENGKAIRIKECQIYEKIFPQEMTLQINLESHPFKVNLKLTAIENAQIIYDQAKKAKKKIDGALKAVEDTKQKLEYQQEQKSIFEDRQPLLIKRPKTKWYEKFRWFFSSDEFLIIGGRDASSNEIIVKKYMKEHDLFFHSDVHGASVCIIKNEQNQPIPESTITETAYFAACYSSAWKEGWGNVDIFYVSPTQVSQTPKTGEYLKKGSFVISGKKDYLQKPHLELAIGVKLVKVESKEEESDVDELQISNTIEINKTEQVSSPITSDDNSSAIYYPQVISAPVSAIKKATSIYVRIRPNKGGLKTSDLAKRIYSQFIDLTPEFYRKWVRMTSLNDLIRIIPSGFAELIP